MKKFKEIVKMKNTTKLVLLLCLTLLITFGVIRQQRIAKAQDQSPQLSERLSFGVVAITSGQTLRVSVANTLMRGDAQYPAGPTRVVMNFRYLNGNLVRDPRTNEVIRSEIDLERGAGAFLDVDYDRLPPGPSRAQIRPVIVVTPPDGTTGENPIPFGSVVPTVEVINNANGRTQFALFTHPAAARGFNPQPDPPRE